MMWDTLYKNWNFVDSFHVQVLLCELVIYFKNLICKFKKSSLKVDIVLKVDVFIHITKPEKLVSCTLLIGTIYNYRVYNNLF